MTKKDLSVLVNLMNKEKSLKESLKDVQSAKAELESSLIEEMKEKGKRFCNVGIFLLKLKDKEKFSLPESKSPLKGKLLDLLKELDLLEVCSNLYAPKVKKLLGDRRLDESVKNKILPYTYVEIEHELEVEIVTGV